MDGCQESKKGMRGFCCELGRGLGGVGWKEEDEIAEEGLEASNFCAVFTDKAAVFLEILRGQRGQGARW